jgi:hypothetical protein
MSVQFTSATRTILLVAMWTALAESTLASPLDQFFARHCVACHSGAEAEAKLDLESLPRDFSDPATLKAFTHIHDRITAGEMPPATEERPTTAELAAVTHWLSRELATADAARIARDGRIRMRRMTRAEYQNTLQDLLALPRLEIEAMLPPDGEVAGFNKVADGLELSPVHLAAYAAAAEEALTRAIATRSTAPPAVNRRIYPAGLFKFGGNLLEGNFVLLKDGQPDPALPIRGGYDEFEWHISAPDANADLEERKQIFKDNDVAKSQSSVGLLVPNIAGYEAAMNVAPVYPGRYRMRLSLWGFHWNQGTVEPASASQTAVLRAHEEGKQQEGGRLLATFTAPSLAACEHEITAWLDAHESIVFDPVSIPWRGLHVRQIGGRTAKHVGPGVAIDWFEIEGPIHESWPPVSHRRLFGDLPITVWPADSTAVPPLREQVRSTPGYFPNQHVDIPPQERQPRLETVHSADPDTDARQLLSRFLPRAWRRPVAPDEVEPYVALVIQRLADGDCFEDAMRRAYVAMLTSPEFLFLPVGDPAAPPDAPDALLALASRLSYWLWNGPPDAALLAAAHDGSLADPAVLHAQIDRLLDHPHSDRFITDFLDQWLELDRIDETTPDSRLYPEFSPLLQEAMIAETRAFVRELIDRDLPITTLIDADFAMLSQRLAEHYGITGVDGVEVRRVPLPPESHRGGLLTQAAILKLTANGTTTSPVKRGVWITDRLFDAPPPPPPPVPAVEPDTRGATTIREQLARHRSDASCSACHAKIDPPGFALESFDPIGGFRERYRSIGQGEVPPEKGQTAWLVHYRLGLPVDPSGTLPDGRSFGNVEELKQILAAEPKRLARAFVTQLSRYATGTDPSFADRQVIEAIVQQTTETHHGLRSLFHALAESRLMQ